MWFGPWSPFHSYFFKHNSNSIQKFWCCNLIAGHQITTNFYPRPVLAFGYCHRLRVWVFGSVCVCNNHELVHMITHRLFKLGSPNLDQRCKTLWFRPLLFLGMIDLDLQGQISLESQILPHFELVHTITHQPFKLELPNLDRKCILALSRSLLILKLETYFSTKFICTLFVYI